MKKLFLLLPVLMAILVTGCLKDDRNEETIMLMGAESGVMPIGEVIPDTLLNFIMDAQAMSPNDVMDLPTGNLPPDIQGEYVFLPRVKFHDNYGNHPAANDTVYLRLGGEQKYIVTTVNDTLYAGDLLIQGTDTVVLDTITPIQVEDTVYYYPEGQHNRSIPCEIYGDILEKDGYKLKKTDAFVMGNGNNFTLYFTVDDYEGESQSGENEITEFTLTRGYIVKGTITPAGIENVVMACVNKDVDAHGDDGNEVLMKNRITFYRVQGGTAIRQKWVKP